MTAPETLEELREAIEGLIGYYAHVNGGEGVCVALSALLPPVPEPIKVGDRVTGHPSYESGEVIGLDNETDQERHLVAWVRWDDERGGTWRDNHFVRDLTRVDSSPSPEPETVEPHESENAGELAVAVRVGLLVESLGDFGEWHRSPTRSFEQFAAFAGAGQRYRIHGTVPGYGETGGVS